MAGATPQCWLAGTAGARPRGPALPRDDRQAEWLFDGWDTCTCRGGRYACSWSELHARTDLVLVPGKIPTLGAGEAVEGSRRERRAADLSYDHDTDDDRGATGEKCPPERRSIAEGDESLEDLLKPWSPNDFRLDPPTDGLGPDGGTGIDDGLGWSHGA